MILMTGLFLLLALPGVVPADCIKVGSSGSFTLVGDDTVILYSGGAAIVKIEKNCTVYEKSRVRIFKNSICEGDDIRIDD